MGVSSASDHVVVSRADKNGERRVIFRGRATSVRNAAPQSCSTYRYTIVSYDRRGRRSTGVPTSVMTGAVPNRQRAERGGGYRSTGVPTSVMTGGCT